MFHKKVTCLVLSISFIALYSMKEEDYYNIDQPINIIADNIDDLILKGIKHINKNGTLFEAKAGKGQQAYDVNYILTNPLNRVHNLRAPISQKYFAKELLAYFNGSLKVDEGLSQASKMWKELADDNGEICSNYGYYVFHQKLPHHDEMTQYDWVIKNFEKNLDTRKAFININQVDHKKLSNKDFPCTLGMQFYTKNDKFHCSVSSRSTDIYTGLPYDMGFFSFVSELVYKDVVERIPEAKDLKLGPVMMKTNFTQIYDKTRTSALKMLEKAEKNLQPYKTDMPQIYDAQQTLTDIYKKTATTPVVKWIHKHAELNTN